VNVDGIVGNTGELISHNMFPYCKNNAINLADYNGYDCEPIKFPTLTCEMHTNGVGNVTFSNIKVHYPSSTKKRKSSIMPSNTQVNGVITNSIITGIEGTVSNILIDIPDYVPVVTNRELRRKGQEFIVPIMGANIARGVGMAEKVGAIGVALTGVTVWDNFHSGYSHQEAFGRSGIDITVSVLAIGIGVFTPVGVAVAAGVGLGLLGEVGKNYIWKKE